MATLIIPGGQQTIDYGTGGPFYDVYDAETNNANFVADYLDYVANNRPESHVSAYPCRFFGANPFVWNGGVFRGTLPATTDWSTWYSLENFNSAALFPRGGISGTINRVVFGIRDDLNSFGTDGIRTTQAGVITINNFTAWGWRDDLIEADGNPNTLNINDNYGENLFVWLSATGNVPNKNINVNRALIHFRRWPYRGAMQYGLPLKTDGAAASPNFNFNNVVLALGVNTFGDSGTRWPGGLQNVTCTGDCRVLVLGGNLQSNTIRNLILAAGFTLVEDGSGSAATNEYLARKEAWLGEGGGGGGSGGAYNPDPTPDPFNGNVKTRIICSGGFFVPEQDTQLIGWFAPDDASTLTHVDGVVSEWRTKRGQAWALTQPTVAARPLTNSRSRNLRKVLDGDGTDFLAGSVSIPADGNYAVHFAAMVDGVTNQYQAILGMNTAWQLEAGNASQFNGYLRVNGADDLVLTGGPFSGLVIGSIVFNKTGNLISVTINGTQRASGPYTSVHSVSQSLKALCNRAQNQFLDGAMMDIIVTADLTKTTEYQNYLSAKYTVV